jgi:hypothetical protein
MIPAESIDKDPYPSDVEEMRPNFVSSKPGLVIGWFALLEQRWGQGGNGHSLVI